MGSAPEWQGMPTTGAFGGTQAGNVVQDLMAALHRIEVRLRRIEEHLGIASPEPETENAGAHGTRRARRETGRARTTTRTSPYA